MIADILDVLPIYLGPTWCIGAIVRPISHEDCMEIVALNLKTWNTGGYFLSEESCCNARVYSAGHGDVDCP